MTKAAADRKVQELAIFHDVAKALTSSLNLDSILQTIMEKMAAYFHPDNWSLLMADEEQRRTLLRHRRRRRLRGPEKCPPQIGEGIAGLGREARRACARARRLHRSALRQAHRRDDAVGDALHHLRSAGSKLRVLGVIQLVNVRMNTSATRNLFFLQSIGDYAAIAIDNARAVEKIQELTITDDCTGLYNARHLYKTLEAEVYRSARFGYEFTVLFLDLDHFKQVNDTHGHLSAASC